MLPINIDDDRALKKHINKDTSKNEWNGSGTILIADDEEAICAISEYMLEQIGFEVISANDGIEAVEMFRERKDDIVCVILDLTMPRLSGEEVYQKINAIKPGIKVILSSGYDEQDVMQRFSRGEIAGFIQKPYSLKLLKEKLKSIL